MKSPFISCSNLSISKWFFPVFLFLLLTRLSFAASDLTITNLSWSPEQVSPGNLVTFSATVRNNGPDAVTDSFYVGFQVNSSSIITPGIVVRNPIASGASTIVTTTWTAVEGTSDIKAIADVTNRIAESSEINNEITGVLPVVVYAADYVVDSIQLNFSSAVVGSSNTVTVSVKNIGGGSTALTSTVGLYIDGNPLSPKSISGLSSGSSANVTFSWTVSSGNHTFRAVCDNGNTITETNELNNEKTSSASIPYPDYIVSPISIIPKEQIIGESVTAEVYIKNNGPVGSSLSTQVRFLVDGISQNSSIISGLSAGDSTAVAFSWTVTRGSHVFRFVVDSTNTTPESDETNNSSTRTFEPALPDLQITSLTYSPANPLEGETVTLYAQVENKGSGGDITNHSVTFFVDGNILGTPSISKDIGLGRRAHAFVNADFEQNSLTNWTSTGSYPKPTLMKRSGSPFDSMYAEMAQTSYTTSPAYLTSSAFTVSDSTLTFDAYTSNNLNGIVEIVNASQTVLKSISPAASTWKPYVVDIRDLMGQSVHIRMKVSHNALVRMDNIRMGQNASAVYVTEVPYYSWTAQVGTHILRAVVDSVNNVMESNESNQAIQIPITIGRADYVVTDISWDPSLFKVGSTLPCTVTVQNQGTYGTAKSSSVQLFIGSTSLSRPLSPLAAGATGKAVFTWTAQVSGTTTLQATCDAGGVVDESNETNNIYTEDITILYPDYTVGPISITPSEQIIGRNDTVRAYVKNSGSTGTVIGSQVQLIVDGVIRTTSSLSGLNAGDSALASFNWTVTRGSHELVIKVDTLNTIIESNETNNQSTRSFEPALPDLQITGISWVPQNPLEGQSVTLYAQVENRGEGGDITDYKVKMSV